MLVLICLCMIDVELQAWDNRAAQTTLVLIPIESLTILLWVQVCWERLRQKLVQSIALHQSADSLTKSNKIRNLPNFELVDEKIAGASRAGTYENDGVLFWAAHDTLDNGTSIFATCHRLAPSWALQSVSIGIKWHNNSLQVLFDVFQSLARSSAIAVDERLLAKWSAQQGFKMAADHVLAQVVEDFYFLGR